MNIFFLHYSQFILKDDKKYIHISIYEENFNLCNLYLLKICLSRIDDFFLVFYVE